MNNKAFTLVELLATILIISLLSGIGYITYTSVVENSRLSAFHAYEKTMHSETIALLIERVELIPSVNQTKRFSLSDIRVEPFINPKNKNDLCLDSYVDVTRTVVGNVDSFTYKVCLICPNSEYNVNGTSCEIYEN